jgi:hypothetical protein
VPANLEVADVPLVRGKHLLREGEFGHVVEGLAVFRGLVVFELVLNGLEIVDGLLFCVQFWGNLFFEDGGEHPAQTSKTIKYNSNQACLV